MVKKRVEKKTRAGELERMLKKAEEDISLNRADYIKKEKLKGFKKGMVPGLVGAGIGATLGYAAETEIGSKLVTTVHKHIVMLKEHFFSDGKTVEKALDSTRKIVLEDKVKEEVIKETLPGSDICRAPATFL